MAERGFLVSIEGRGIFYDASSYLAAASTGALSSNPSWQDHPLWETSNAPGRLHAEISQLFPSNSGSNRIQSVHVPVAKQLDGYGWIIDATIIGPEPPSLFASQQAAVPYTIQIQIPATYPNKHPIVKFAKIIYHPNVQQRTLLLDDLFYQRLNWNPETCKLKTMIELVIFMLESPILPSGPSDHDIKHLWHHESPEMLELPPAELRAAIQTFRSEWLEKNYISVVRELSEYQHERITNMFNYERKYPRLYDATKPLEPDWFDGDLWNALQSRSPKAIQSLLREEFPGVYSVQFFSKAFCEAFLEEIINFERSGLPWRRPNSMNRYGVVLDDIGMEDIMQRIMMEVVSPLASLLYPSAGGSSLDNHHAFVVQYQQGQDVKLEMHTDDSEVTINVCLGVEGFKGSGLSFCGVKGQPGFLKYQQSYSHQIGRAVIHLGAQRHGADTILEGRRYNLIMWCTSNRIREKNSSRPLLEEYQHHHHHHHQSHGHDQPMGEIDARCLKSNGRI